MKKKPAFSLRNLSKEFGIDRATATKLCADASTEDEAREAIQAWRETRREGESVEDCDPQTGLSWWKAKLREEVLRTRQLREAERIAADGDLVPLSVLDHAAEFAAAKFRRLGENLYNYGALDVETRPLVDRLGKEFVEDFVLWVREWAAAQSRRYKKGTHEKKAN